MKYIPGYEEKYSITSCGKVWSHKGNKWRKPTMCKPTGYLKVKLLNLNGKMWNAPIHRLVLLTYIGPSKLHCNHIDGIKTNNNLSNLEYISQKENNRHAIKTGLNNNFMENHHNAKLKNKDAYFIKYKSDDLSINELSNMFGVSTTTILDIINGRTWKTLLM